MTREIVLDTETTGLDAAEHSVIEIGCLEIFDRRVTGRSYHQYIKPGRMIDAEAVAVHGITMEQLQDKPPFAEIIDPFLAFVGDAALVIHNAAFDMGFLAAEFERCQRQADWPPAGEVIDTLLLARDKHPNQRNSLDALCKRYEVDNSGRELHGALLDAELLAEVYLRLTGGQNLLDLSAETGSDGPQISVADVLARHAGRQPRLRVAREQEWSSHRRILERMCDADPVWAEDLSET